MKWLMATLISILSIQSAYAENILRMKVESMQDTSFDYMFEIKVKEYPRVVLDCQSFIMGMSFYYDDYLERSIYLPEEDCQAVHQFIGERMESKTPVCMELNADENSLLFSEKDQDCK